MCGLWFGICGLGFEVWGLWGAQRKTHGCFGERGVSDRRDAPMGTRDKRSLARHGPTVDMILGIYTGQLSGSLLHLFGRFRV